MNTDWDFLDYLVDDNPNSDTATFDIAIKNLFDELNELEAQKKELLEKGETGVDSITKVISTKLDKDWISFLAENNVLPRYGFPIYVVPLTVYGNSISSKDFDLNRDLRMAIVEYAPGKQVVAGGRYFKPYALEHRTGKGWPTFDFATCSRCGKTYFYSTALGAEGTGIRQKECCHVDLTYKQILIPAFGFKTSKKDNETIKKRDEENYSSVSIFDGFSNSASIEQKDYVFMGGTVKTSYSPLGNMYIINRGKFAKGDSGDLGIGFKVCEECGYVHVPLTDLKTEHLTAGGRKCAGKMFPCYFGQHFRSDALALEFDQDNTIWEYDSLLYAILEGASMYMGIDRRELGGSIWKNGEKDKVSIVLFDTVPNGAGHVKRIKDNILQILESALQKVDGRCGCSEDTCCYGCLRNYDNQARHDTMARGNAYDYLSRLMRI